MQLSPFISSPLLKRGCHSGMEVGLGKPIGTITPKELSHSLLSSNKDAPFLCLLHILAELNTIAHDNPPLNIPGQLLSFINHTCFASSTIHLLSPRLVDLCSTQCASAQRHSLHAFTVYIWKCNSPRLRGTTLAYGTFERDTVGNFEWMCVWLP